MHSCCSSVCTTYPCKVTHIFTYLESWTLDAFSHFRSSWILEDFYGYIRETIFYLFATLFFQYRQVAMFYQRKPVRCHRF